MNRTIKTILIFTLALSALWGQTSTDARPKRKSGLSRFMSPELRKLRDELGILKAKDGIRSLKLKLKHADSQKELYELAVAEKLASAKLRKELSNLKRSIKALELKRKLAEAKSNDQLIGLNRQRRRLALEIDVEKKKGEREMLSLKTKTQLVAMQNEALRKLIAANELKYKKEVKHISNKIALSKKKEEASKRVLNEMIYYQKPYRNKVLHISDRRIALNGPIMRGSADFVSSRINYFNNKSQSKPIFIVINVSPGGSVMEGYRILKAMKTSKAPVHVVVKSFAASMAAVIVTNADHSYAYKNAIILHHQPSSGMRGNVAQQKQKLKTLKEWARRLHEPVAKKMKLSLNDFYEAMYKNHIDGDWQEFADNAKKIGWVQNIVEEIREHGYTEAPTKRPPKIKFIHRAQKKELAQNEQMLLPKPLPFDFYFLYNPQGDYIWY